jgi:uncharacterized small protein (DUF1192 family)
MIQDIRVLESTVGVPASELEQRIDRLNVEIQRLEDLVEATPRQPSQ